MKELFILRYIASLKSPNITAGRLKEVDRKIRACLRSILHLNAHCHSSIFYAPVKAWGIEIFNYTDNIPVIVKSRISKLRNASTLLNSTFELNLLGVGAIDRLIRPDAINKATIARKHATAKFVFRKWTSASAESSRQQ